MENNGELRMYPPSRRRMLVVELIIPSWLEAWEFILYSATYDVVGLSEENIKEKERDQVMITQWTIFNYTNCFIDWQEKAHENE